MVELPYYILTKQKGKLTQWEITLDQSINLALGHNEFLNPVILNVNTDWVVIFTYLFTSYRLKFGYALRLSSITRK